MEKKIKVAVLGSTGSIGRQTLEVIDFFKDKFEVIALSSKKNVSFLAEQIRKYKPKYVSISREAEKVLKNEIGNNIKFVSQNEIVKSDEVDIVVAGIPGFDSVEPVIEAAKHGKTIAVASKEAILCGGEILFSIAKKTGAKILPIDSEHSSLWKIIERYGKKNIKKVYITASGGPFLNTPKEEFENIKVEDALKHPVWKMGEKITVDSATLMNKAFEIIEASYLFEIPPEIISIKVHPEAIVHSAVEYKDGTTIMSCHFPDMRIPIMYSLLYGKDFEVPFEVPGIWDKEMRFLDPDTERFPSVLLGWRCAKYPMPCVLVSADDVAVELFLKNKIKFTHIFQIVEKTLSHFEKEKISVKEFSEIKSLAERAKITAYKTAEEFMETT